jgi:RNA polymerase sigma-70 factor (ECF subfamily)
MIDDLTLITHIQQGDEVAFLRLYKRHESYVRSVVIRHLGADEAVDDVVQEVFYSLLDKLRYFRGECAFTTFLYSIARNKTVDTIRRRQVARVVHKVVPHSIMSRMRAIVGPDPLERADVEARIDRIFASLPNDYALIIRLKYQQDMSIEQISQQVGLSQKAVESRLFRARQLFKRLWIA